jgi:hypothetical protein
MRDDFSVATRTLLAKRVGFRCSNPGCRQLTSGPQQDPAGATNIGVAAHITAASPEGPRYDVSLTSEERGSPANGIWLCQNHGKLVDNDHDRFSCEMLRDWKRAAEEWARSELENPGRPIFDQTVFAHEQLRARLSVAGVKLVEPLAAGKIPQLNVTIVNTGHTTAEKITGAYQGITGPSLPKWEMSEFDQVGAAHGQPAPKRDEFYSTSLEPGVGKAMNMQFPKLGIVLHALGSDHVKRLGLPHVSKGLPTVIPRVFFFGYFEYKTLGKTYRLNFCFTPKVYSGTELGECPQWNGTEELDASSSPTGREERHVTADVQLISIKLSTGDSILDASTRMALLFVNIGPTPAVDLEITFGIGTFGHPSLGRSAIAKLDGGLVGLQIGWSKTLAEIVGADLVTRVINGTVPLTVETEITYKDTWGENHESRFEFTYSLKVHGFERTPTQSPAPPTA